MLAFLDFEASSLARHSYPIEVAWVFEDGRSETHLIQPAPGWDDWNEEAEAIHHISRDMLLQDGLAHDIVAHRMVAALIGHDLAASAPSWDGKWLSVLLRTAKLPRHTLRLRHTKEAQCETARNILRRHIPAEQLNEQVERLRVAAIEALPAGVPAHRALADAQQEYARWHAVRTAAEQFRDSSAPREDP